MIFKCEIVLIYFSIVALFFGIEASEQCQRVSGKRDSGMRLKGHTFMTIRTAGFYQCLEECLPRGHCSSINYNQDKQLCELNDLDKSGVPLSNDEDYFYTDIEQYFVLVGVCASYSCGQDSKCIQLPDGSPFCLKTFMPCDSSPCLNSGTCINIERSYECVCPDDYRGPHCEFVRCESVPIVEHASPSGSGEVIGDQYTTFTCDVGYTMTGNNKITCTADGTWSAVSFTCISDCKSLFDAGFTTDGIYEISPDGSQRFNVYCNMADGGWVVINRRVDGSVDFNRGWTAYTNGFGYLAGNLWLGLKYIHLLAKEPNFINFEFLMESNGNVALANYTDFTVADESDKFRMYVASNGTVNNEMSQYINSYFNGFSYHNGMQFTTKDSDNDLQQSTNCASYPLRLLTGGYWYNACIQVAGINNEYGNMYISRGGFLFDFFTKCEVRIRRMN